MGGGVEGAQELEFGQIMALITALASQQGGEPVAEQVAMMAAQVCVDEAVGPDGGGASSALGGCSLAQLEECIIHRNR